MLILPTEQPTRVCPGASKSAPPPLPRDVALLGLARRNGHQRVVVDGFYKPVTEGIKHGAQLECSPSPVYVPVPADRWRGH